MSLLPKPGALTERGLPVDVLASIRAKRTIAEILVPECHAILKEHTMLYGGSGAIDEQMLELEKIAEMFGISLLP